MYEVLSEVNKIRVDGKLLDVVTKNKLIDDLFLNKKIVKDKDVINWLKKNQLKVGENNWISKRKSIFIFIGTMD